MEPVAKINVYKLQDVIEFVRKQIIHQLSTSEQSRKRIFATGFPSLPKTGQEAVKWIEEMGHWADMPEETYIIDDGRMTYILDSTEKCCLGAN